MKNRIALRLNFAKRTALAAAATAAIVVPILIGIASPRTTQAQAQPTEHYAFEVASVKPHVAGDNRFSFPAFLPGGRFTANAPLFSIIAAAYGLAVQGAASMRRLPFGPNWTASEDIVYDIEATAPTGAFLPGLSAKDRADRERLMLQSLLADRFKLVVHHESKEMPVYALVVGKGGPKLQKADIEEKDCPDTASNGFPSSIMPNGCHQFNGGRGRGLHARAVDMADLVAIVENWTDKPLLNKTGIKGLYKIETEPWLPIELTTSPPAPGTKQDGVDVGDLPTLFTVFERLGLKMESQRDRVDTIVIDHIDKPSEN